MFKPFEIPGTSIKIPQKPGKEICPKCKRDFEKFKLIDSGGHVEQRCPYCNELIKKKKEK